MIPKLRLPCEIIFTLLTGVHDTFSYDSKEGYHILNLIEIYDSKNEVTLPFPKTTLLCHQNVYVVNANTILHKGTIL